MGDPGWTNDWWGRDPIEETFDPVRARQEDEEAFNRLRKYIEEHRGNLLALNLMNHIYDLYRSGK